MHQHRNDTTTGDRVLWAVTVAGFALTIAVMAWMGLGGLSLMQS